jgi:hypothetical protein
MAANCKPIQTATYLGGGKLEIPLTFQVGKCWGAFLSLQGAVGFMDPDGSKILGICAPPESTLTQLVRIFMNHVEAHPEDLHRDYVLVVLQALIATFPCR